MTHVDAGHYARKHGPGAIANPVVRDALLKRVVNGKLPCAIAFDVARRLGVPADAVGRIADLMELRLVKCQLGLFGYGPRKSIIKPATSVPLALEKAIRDALLNDRLPCDSAWEIAKSFGIHKMKVSAACDALEIKIRPCQLGAFYTSKGHK
jgi:hypothetical protein